LPLLRTAWNGPSINSNQENPLQGEEYLAIEQIISPLSAPIYKRLSTHSTVKTPVFQQPNGIAIYQLAG
jgi:hypothetical protein